MRRSRPLLLALLCLGTLLSSGCPGNLSPVGTWAMSVWDDCEGEPDLEMVLVFNEGGTGTMGPYTMEWTYIDGLLRFGSSLKAPLIYEGEFRGRNRLKNISSSQRCWEAHRVSDNP